MDVVTKENIGSLLRAGENQTVEFKAGASVIGLKYNLPKVISAFANTEGGVIILGYDESRQLVIGTSTGELEIVKKVILDNKLENICYGYIVPFEDRNLIIIQVEKSRELVIVSGGAYIRKKDANIVLTTENIMTRVKVANGVSEPVSSNENEDRTYNLLKRTYDELIRSEKKHEEEMEAHKQAHEREVKNAKKSNWFFCILSAVIGYVLGKLF